MYGAITVGLVIEIDDLFRKKCKRRRRWKIC
jgi:hypothetical protein